MKQHNCVTIFINRDKMGDSILTQSKAKRIFAPTAYYKDISNIDWKRIYELGYRLVLLDADNTLIPHGQRKKTDFSLQALEKIRATKLEVSILSNAKKARAEALGRSLGVAAEGMANKPGPKGIWRACEKFDVPVDQTILVGDQFFTDMLAGKRAGCKTILVDPIVRDEPWYIRIKRWQERRMYKRRGWINHYDELPDVNLSEDEKD